MILALNSIEVVVLIRSRLLIGALVSLAIVSAALATVIVRRLDSAAPPSVSGSALIGGPFTLTDDEGRRVSDRDFRGSYMLVYFGYTYCPDICPSGLQTMAQALDLLAPQAAAKIVPVFVTLDPERDDVPAMHHFVGALHPRFVGLTGSPQEIAGVTRAYRVYARKAPMDAGRDYLVEHSTFTYLIGPDGTYITRFGHGVAPEQMAAKISQILGAGSS